MLSPLPGPAPPLPLAVLTGLVVSLPRLPLLLRLPISVWELDCDIPSKKGLWAAKKHSQGQSGAARPQNSNLWSAERAGVLERLKTRASRMSGERNTAEADKGGAGLKDLREFYRGFCQLNGTFIQRAGGSSGVRSQDSWSWGVGKRVYETVWPRETGAAGLT